MTGVTRTRFTIIGAGAGGICTGIKLLESGRDDFDAGRGTGRFRGREPVVFAAEFERVHALTDSSVALLGFVCGQGPVAGRLKA